VKTFLIVIIGLLLVASVAATGVLIQAQTKEAGLNDAAFFAYHDGKESAAEKLYRMALAQNPDYETARYNLATLLFQQGRFDEAIPELERLITLDPSNPGYHYDLAVNLIENIRQHQKGLEEFDRAISEYQAADELSPGYAHVKENLEVLYRIRAEA
jgi:tetratricopeptide (TPR) repeat protein